MYEQFVVDGPQVTLPLSECAIALPSQFGKLLHVSNRHIRGP
ncbi:MAG: hypothetical protein WA783_06290 [Phormidesmis sp.]